MEKNKQLNLSAPLLSVRRHSFPRATTDGLDRKATENSLRGIQHSLPVNKSIIESEAVAKPASVPFLWENSPGRPKGECRTSSREEPSVTPRLPTGRLSDSSWRSGEVYSPRLPLGRLSNLCHPKSYQARLTGEVCSPRLDPGMFLDARWRSGEVNTQRFTSGRLSDLRHLSGEQSRELNMSKYQSEAFVVSDHALLLENLKESLNADVESIDDIEEDGFSEALDTLSPTKSLSMNCSVSGLGNYYDGQNCVQSAVFSADPQARDLMLRRFLTAAKAAVSETPQHVSRKQSPVIEEPKIFGKVISMEKKTSMKQPGFDPEPVDNKYNEDVKNEDDIDFQETNKRIGKGCGLFPRLCVRSSSSILHQGSETKCKTQPSTPSHDEVRKLNRNCYSMMKLKTQTSSPSSGEVKGHTRNAYSGPIDKCVYDAFYTKNYYTGFLSQELHKVGNKLTDGPKRVASTSDSNKMAEERSFSTRSRSTTISPYRNERSPSPFREGARFLGLPKEVELKAEKISSLIRRDKIIMEVSSLRSHKQGSEPSGNSVDKRLHNRSTLNVNEERSLIYLSWKVETPSRSDLTPLHSVAKSSKEDINNPHLFEQGSLGFKEPIGDGNLILNKNARNKERILQTEHSPPPPPSPKSPSESWLWRTLPSISLHSKKQSPSPKWERMVKSSKVHHDHVRYSEELVSHITHQHDRR